jgi:RimJ/RimL family protein N-acetyltransferase
MIPARLLSGDTIRLTAVEPGDMPALTRWYQDTQFLRLWDADVAVPLSEKQVCERVTEAQKSRTGYVFAIRKLDRDELLGMVELDGIVWSQRVGWLSIAIGDPAQRGQGTGYEALRLLLRFAFDELNLRRVQLTVFSYNEPAIRLYEKLGFRHEGTFRAFVQRDGALYDMLLYGLLRHEWEAGV